MVKMTTSETASSNIRLLARVLRGHVTLLHEAYIIFIYLSAATYTL